MALSSFGVDITERELRALCDCTYYGTDALKAVDAVRKLGFVGSAKYTLSVEELRMSVTDGRYPIVFVDMHPLDGIRNIHALVVIGTSQQEMIVLDPLKGKRSLTLQAFSTAWAMRHNLTIIID